MKILHITDSHGTVKSPESRQDVYYLAFLKKFYELGLVIKQQHIDMVIHTGDLFHTARVSDKFAGQVSELIKTWGVPMYVVPGNHDIEGYTVDTIDQTKLGLLAKTGVIQLLDRESPIRITATQPNTNESYTVAISGQEYYAHIDEGNMQDFEMQQNEADFNILAIHGYIADTPQNPNIKCTMVQDVLTDADVILTGHYHRQFEYNGPDVDIYNPGSMLRVDQTEYNRTHTPMYGILEIKLDENGDIEYSYDFYKFRIAQPSAVVFDYVSKSQAKKAHITLNGFKDSIAATMQATTSSVNIYQIIQDICANAPDVTPDILNKASYMYTNALQNAPDTFEVQQGFIEATNRKYIQRVELNNFQSHAHTVVDFTNGLNIIVGESNKGKTSILRAIMWVVDNQPLGSDFIMAGKDSCSVTVSYSDGTSITRGRTRKDTGFYDVYYKDENGTLQRATYRGFTNAVPVEVANIHQMPKVNITKDIETHLNVLSQLDGPFLLTESPQVKASAIGRITGTHILDDAIKTSNKLIQSNRKTVKVLSTEKQEKEDKLKQLPDIDRYEYYLNIYKALYTKAKMLHKTCETLAAISQLDNEIAKTNEEIKRFSTVAMLSHGVKSAQEKLRFILGLENRTELVSKATSDIESLKNSINIFSKVALMHPIVIKANSILELIKGVQNRTQEISSIEMQIDNIRNRNKNIDEYLKYCKDIIVHSTLMNNFVAKLTPKFKELEEINNEIAKTKVEINNVDTTIKTLNKQIRDISKQILDNKICPCCGQPIKQSEVQNIIMFMEGR